jgi:hypothetical protein
LFHTVILIRFSFLIAYCNHWCTSHEFCVNFLLILFDIFQHSMLYFFHHYELPLILRQVQLQNMLIRTTNSSSAGGSSAGVTATSTESVIDRNHRSPGPEADSDAQVDFETRDRDSDSPAPETLSDDSEMESIADGVHSDADPPANGGDGSSSSSIITAASTTSNSGVEILPADPHPVDLPNAQHPLRDRPYSLLR